MTDGYSARRPRVLLISMPWANPGHPQLGLGLLKAILQRSGIHSDVHYANLSFFHFLEDWETYQYMMLSMEGDLVFTPHYFDTDVRQAAATLQARAAGNGFHL